MKPAIADAIPQPVPAAAEAESAEQFQTGQVLTIAGGHVVNDTYTALTPALLPVLIEKLSLSLPMAGSLTAIQQLPALLNPFIGYLADRVSLRYFVILAPAVTGTLISCMGLAPSYLVLAFIMLLSGVSIAAFHAPAPAMIGRITGRQVGKGMSLFMAAGELARTIGPLIAVWAISLWTLNGIYRLAVIGWATSLILFWRLRTVPARTDKQASLRAAFPAMRRLFIPIISFTLFRNFMIECLVTYLPVYMSAQGSSLWIAGAALSILELAVGGALVGGTASDRLGRKPILLAATLASDRHDVRLHPGGRVGAGARLAGAGLYGAVDDAGADVDGTGAATESPGGGQRDVHAGGFRTAPDRHHGGRLHGTKAWAASGLLLERRALPSGNPGDLCHAEEAGRGGG